MLKSLVNGIVKSTIGIISQSIYKWHCGISIDKIDESLKHFSRKCIFYQCDNEKALYIETYNKNLHIYKLNRDDTVKVEILSIDAITSIDIIEYNNVDGDSKYIRLKISTNSLVHPYAEVIFLKPMYLSGDGYFRKDTEAYQQVLQRFYVDII